MKNVFNKKISIIGAGNVGSTTAYTLMLSGLVSELVIVDKNKEKAEGESMDIIHGLPFVKPMKIYSGDYPSIEGSDIVIIAAGSSIGVGQSRLELVGKSVEIFKEILEQVVKYASNSIVLVVSNPVDIMTYVTYKLTGFPKNKIIGSGTVLDTARFKSLIGEHLSVDPRSVEGYILGEHGDSEVAAWSVTSVGGIAIEDYCNQTGSCSGNLTKEVLAQSVRVSGYEVARKKGATQFAVSLATTRIVQSIFRNENSVLTVSSLLEGEYGMENVCLSVPTIVNANGVEKILKVNLAEKELVDLQSSGKLLKDVIKSVEL